jgi:predicted nucleic acid-binding protein
MQVNLLDAGPVVALLDQRDPMHDFVLRSLAGIRGPVATTGAVITESFHLLGRVPLGPLRITALLARLSVEIFDCFTRDRMDRAVALMDRYRDIPMDFADATLVLLAEHLATPRILTLDERGFRAFRFAGKRRFQLLLQDQAGAS